MDREWTEAEMTAALLAYTGGKTPSEDGPVVAILPNGIVRKSGMTFEGAFIIEYDEDPFLKDEPYADTCARCEREMAHGYLILDGGDLLCYECVEVVPAEEYAPTA